jgi:hypothetical protein
VDVITKVIGLILNIILLPFFIIGGMFSGVSRASNSDRNMQNGADIRALCGELGVPSADYNRIIINQMDRAKELALKIGQPGEAHHASPWNTRLALAISALYKEKST